MTDSTIRGIGAFICGVGLACISPDTTRGAIGALLLFGGYFLLTKGKKT